ncbi:hypothetical protein BLOT_003302 [Blomia tropicalis]|nr:hypothetical protein BLOT_003302 [Blomia tropicalis]
MHSCAINSPLHGTNQKKDLVELQSFYHHHYHHGHENNREKGRPPGNSNYALPYDVLPVSRDNSNLVIYGQTATKQWKWWTTTTTTTTTTTAAAADVDDDNNAKSADQCRTIFDEVTANELANRNNSSSRANYESLVPIACSEPLR